jgi:hypothetical protein
LRAGSRHRVGYRTLSTQPVRCRLCQRQYAGLAKSRLRG